MMIIMVTCYVMKYNYLLLHILLLYVMFTLKFAASYWWLFSLDALEQKQKQQFSLQLTTHRKIVHLLKITELSF